MSALKYIGGGAYIIGVPARDLSADEAQRYEGTIAMYAPGIYGTLDNKPIASQPAQEAPGDDLTVIKGIGTQVANALATEGVITFQQLIDADPVALDLSLAGSSENQIRSWQFQAQQFTGDK